MGQQHSELDPRDIETLRACTPLTNDEIKAFYQEFLRQYPMGLVARDDLRRVYKKRYPKGNPDDLVEEMFRVYDANMSGRIDFREFLCGLGFMAHGNDNEKLTMAFQMYDHDGSGEATVDELRSLVQAIYKATAKKRYDEAEATKVGTAMFSQMDMNGDGRVTQEEFVRAAKSDESITNMLKMLNPEYVAHQKKKH